MVEFLTKRGFMNVRQLEREHYKIAKKYNAEFLNNGWSSGDDFIHSKTTKGRLFSIVKAGKIKHYWTPGGNHGFSANITKCTLIK